MWQRVQTIFLAVAIACLVAMIFFPVWEVNTETHRQVLYPIHYLEQTKDQAGKVTTTTDVYFPYSFISILAIAAATLAFIEIQKFNNRLLQMKMGMLNALLMAACLFTTVYLAMSLQKTAHAPGVFGFSVYLPFAAMVLNMIANRFIRRDEKLVKDSDRLR